MKKTIIIVLVIIVLAAIAIGIFFLLHQQPASTTTQSPTPTNSGGALATSSTNTPGAAQSFFLSDAGISQSEITPGAPPDAPQGATIMFQTASGTIALKNFYLSAQGYWAPLNTLLLADGPSYTLWYYRDSSEFEIDIPPDGGLFDEDGGAAQLSTMLGVSQQQLCSLPVTVVYVIDGGADGETAPLDFCTPAAL